MDRGRPLGQAPDHARMANAPRVDDAFGEEVAPPRDQRQDAFGRKMIHRVGRIGGERKYAKPRAGVARQPRLEQRYVQPLPMLKRIADLIAELQADARPNTDDRTKDVE